MAILIGMLPLTPKPIKVVSTEMLVELSGTASQSPKTLEIKTVMGNDKYYIATLTLAYFHAALFRWVNNALGYSPAISPISEMNYRICELVETLYSTNNGNPLASGGKFDTGL